VSMNQSPSRPPSGPVTGWRVIDQVPGTDIGPQGYAVRGVRVYFVTGKGVNGSVFIPENRYTPKNVQATVADLAATIDAVHALQG